MAIGWTRKNRLNQSSKTWTQNFFSHFHTIWLVFRRAFFTDSTRSRGKLGTFGRRNSNALLGVAWRDEHIHYLAEKSIYWSLRNLKILTFFAWWSDLNTKTAIDKHMERPMVYISHLLTFRSFTVDAMTYVTKKCIFISGLQTCLSLYTSTFYRMMITCRTTLAIPLMILDDMLTDSRFKFALHCWLKADFV